MLVFVVELHTAASQALVRLIVIFDMIRAQPLAPVVQIHFTVGAGDVSLTALRSGRGKLGNSALAGQLRKLRARNGAEQREDARNQGKNRPKRGATKPELKNFADHAICKIR